MTSSLDDGGDPACWAHLFEEPATLLSEADLPSEVTGGSDGVAVADDDGRLVFWNDHMATILGWTASDVLGEPFDIAVPAPERRHVTDAFFELIRAGNAAMPDKPVICRGLHSDGYLVELRIVVSALGFGGHGRLRGIIAVITRFGEISV